MHRRMNYNDAWVSSAQFVGRGFTAVGRAVVDDPEDAASGAVRLLLHDVIIGRPATQCSNTSTTSATRKLLRPTATPLFQSYDRLSPGAAADRRQVAELFEHCGG